MAVAGFGTIALMRLAPGYYTDTGEMDAQSAGLARQRLAGERVAGGSLLSQAGNSLAGWTRGNFGRSRQYDVPVSELLLPRIHITAALLAESLTLGWLAALGVAVPLTTWQAFCRSRSARRGPELPITLASAALLAMPVGALATFCLLSGSGGPVAVLALLVGARGFKFLYRLLMRAWQAPYLLQARAQGLTPGRIVRAHLAAALAPELLALATMSLVTVLGASVPVEVVFNVAGVGQLAWNAAMNRDLPVLLAVTLLMAFSVALADMLSTSGAPPPRAAKFAGVSDGTSWSPSLATHRLQSALEAAPENA